MTWEGVGIAVIAGSIGQLIGFGIGRALGGFGSSGMGSNTSAQFGREMIADMTGISVGSSVDGVIASVANHLNTYGKIIIQRLHAMAPRPPADGPQITTSRVHDDGSIWVPALKMLEWVDTVVPGGRSFEVEWI
jgi:hypothetical protein